MRSFALALLALALLGGLALTVRFITLSRASAARGGRDLSPDEGISPLAPCPRQPGCARREFTASTPVDLMQAALLAALAAEPRTRVVVSRPGYLRAEATTRLFRFVDDVEVRLDAATGQVELRSASRVGRSDLGANGARLERLLRTINAAE